MKKYISCALALSLTLAAGAQSWQDAMLYSQYEYGGTARSIALSNALTAVGGDLGSIGINPAGSAVAGYSQMAITSGLSISVANATSSAPDLGFGDKVRTGYTRVKMPNVGFVLVLDTGQRTGLRRISFGLVSNSTSDYTSRMYASGINPNNSFCGSVASFASGYPVEALSGYNADGTVSKYDWFNLDNFAETRGLDWREMVAYRSGIIGEVSSGRILGLTDWDKDGTNTGILADLDQTYGIQTKGYKHDMIINLGLDYGDELYLGANLGISMLAYGQGEYWREAPANEAAFPDIPFDSNPNGRFKYLEMKRLFEARGKGLYFKAGALWRPAGGLRLGAAIQTPTYMDLETRMAVYGKAVVSGVSLHACQSPEWEDMYTLVTPWRFNLGAAYTFGSVALLSVDWEASNFRRNRFRETADSGFYYGSAYFNNVNADIYDVLGWSHSLRAGAEIKLGPNFSLRGGYSLVTTPEHNFLEWVYDPTDGQEHLCVFELTEQERAAMSRHCISGGFGLTSGAFFLDAAVRCHLLPNRYFTPYAYNGTQDPVYDVPEVTASYRRWDAMVTLGMRF